MIKEAQLATPQIDDLIPSARLHAEVWLETYANMYPEPTVYNWLEEYSKRKFSEANLAQRRELFEAAADRPDQIFYRLAKDVGGQVVGLVAGRKDEQIQELEALFVARKYHGRSVGADLMDEFMQWTDSSRPVHLWVMTRNARAVRFYEKYGFEVVCGTEQPYKQNSPMQKVRMVKEGERS